LFPDPDEFATFCNPDNFRWQLLNQAFSKPEFLKLPVFTPTYFKMQASLLSPQTGSISTHNGKMDVEIGFPRKYMETIQLGYVLDNMNKKDNTSEKNMLKRHVFVNRKPTKFIIEIVFPVPGRYLFDVYVQCINTTGEATLERLCQFRFLSDRKFTKETLPDPLPEVPAVGWGPGPKCRHLGLIPLTHFDGCMYIRPGEVRDIRFRTTRDLDVQPQLTHSYLPIYQLVEQVLIEFFH